MRFEYRARNQVDGLLALQHCVCLFGLNEVDKTTVNKNSLLFLPLPLNELVLFATFLLFKPSHLLLSQAELVLHRCCMDVRDSNFSPWNRVRLAPHHQWLRPPPTRAFALC